MLSPITEAMTGGFKDLELVYLNNIPYVTPFEVSNTITRCIVLNRPDFIRTDYGIIPNLGPLGNFHRGMRLIRVLGQANHGP